MEEEQEMLPLWNGVAFPKPKLPKRFSWVVGVERLSERFAALSQFGNLQVWFIDHPAPDNPRMTITKAVALQLPQQVFTVWYSAGVEPRWYFMVFPVESEKRAHVREFLETQAFPEVEKWMRQERAGTWLQGDKHLRCIWNRTDDVIALKEEHR
jgi:hypothetical protein